MPQPEEVGSAIEPVETPEPPIQGPVEPESREWFRGSIAAALVLVFALEVLFGFWLIGCAGSPADMKERLAVLKELAAIFLGPTIALVGAATGFYFGRAGS